MRNPRLDHVLRHCRQGKEQRELAGGWVYFIQDGEFVKIGVAVDVGRRLALLQIGNPRELKLLRSFECIDPYEYEEIIHAELEKYRVRGEWFRLPQAVLDLIQPRPGQTKA